MSGLGIVRRIDELGRIVIPKEMRRTMHLSEGDEMEISSSGDSLTLRKYSTLTSILPMVRSVAKSLVKETGGTAIFAGTDSAMVCEGEGRKMYASKNLTESFSSLLRKRESCLLEGSRLSDMFEGVKADCDFALVEPVIARGDLIGSAILLLKGKPQNSTRAYLGFCAQIISAAIL